MKHTLHGPSGLQLVNPRSKPVKLDYQKSCINKKAAHQKFSCLARGLIT